MRESKVITKNYWKKYIIVHLLILTILIIGGCEISAPEDVIQPGKLKIQLIYKAGDNYQLQEGDFLYAQARDFKIFNDNKFADVFQHPDQIIEQPDSIVLFNMLYAARVDTVIQVAYGSIPPLEYDSLNFQVTPLINIIGLNRRLFPISTSYDQLPIENDYSKVIKLKNKIKIEEGKTTTLVIEFNIEDNLFRVLDDFIYRSKPDTNYTF